MRKYQSIISLSFVLAATWGCGSDGSGDNDSAQGDAGASAAAGAGNDGSGGSPANAGYTVVKSDLEREPSSAVDDQLAETTRGGREFAWNLYEQVVNGDENLFFSPYSITTALAMAYAGAVGTTKTEMAAALQFTQPDETLHKCMNSLDLLLESRNQPATEAQSALTLRVENAVWADEDYMPVESYLDTMARYYGSGMYLVDYASDPEAARKAINAAVADWTEDRIKELIAAGLITPSTALVLTNTIYLLAPWDTPFAESDTAPATFTNHDGQAVEVETMQADLDVSYAEGEGYEVVALPYRGRDLELVIAIPDAGTYDAFEDALDRERMDEITAELEAQRLHIHLPKFTVRSPIELNQPLMSLGMQMAFTGAADFSGISPNMPPISAVVHEAFVDVTESGTEAAAATAVIFGESAPPPADDELHVNRPFVFFIRDVPTNAVLFVGRVLALEP